MSLNYSNPMGVGTDLLNLVNKEFSGKFIEAARPKAELWNGDIPGVVDKNFNSKSKEIQIFLMGDMAEPIDFQPGNDEIAGQQVKIDEITFTKDKFLTVSAALPKDQVLHSPVDTAAKIGQKLGPRWMRKYNSRCFRLWVTAARTGARTKEGVLIHSGGNRITRLVAAGGYDAQTAIMTAYPLTPTGATNLYLDFLALGTAIRSDDNDGAMIAVVDPYIESVMLLRPDQFDRTLNPAEVPNSLVGRYVGKFAGFMVYKSNNIPRDTVADTLSKYSGDYTHGAKATSGAVAVLACCAQPGDEIIAINAYQSVMTNALYIPEKMSWLFWAEGYYGCGVKAPYSAGSIEVTTD
jgi:hypothetical protein